MDKQTIFDAVQQIFRDNFDDEELELTRETCADDIEDWDSLEQINFKLEDVRGLKNVGDLLDLIERMAG